METTSYYTPNCVLFKKAFQGMPNVTTFETEFCDDERYHDFDGTVYINHGEFISVGDFGDRFMVYINNPLWGDDDEQHDIPEHQWVFGYYKSLNRAINRAKAITLAGRYPKPLETETTDYNTLILRQDGTLIALVNDKQITSDSVIIDKGRFEIHGLNKCIIKRGSCKKITPDVIEFTSDDGEVTHIKETKEYIFNIQEIIK